MDRRAGPGHIDWGGVGDVADPVGRSDCNLGGGNGSYHWHWDSHPDGHCPPNYIPGDVVSPGWCGVITGSFID